MCEKLFIMHNNIYNFTHYLSTRKNNLCDLITYLLIVIPRIPINYGAKPQSIYRISGCCHWDNCISVSTAEKQGEKFSTIEFQIIQKLKIRKNVVFSSRIKKCRHQRDESALRNIKAHLPMN